MSKSRKSSRVRVRQLYFAAPGREFPLRFIVHRSERSFSGMSFILGLCGSPSTPQLCAEDASESAMHSLCSPLGSRYFSSVAGPGASGSPAIRSQMTSFSIQGAATAEILRNIHERALKSGRACPRIFHWRFCNTLYPAVISAFGYYPFVPLKLSRDRIYSAEAHRESQDGVSGGSLPSISRSQLFL